jgi:hypothetical protein
VRRHPKATAVRPIARTRALFRTLLVAVGLIVASLVVTAAPALAAPPTTTMGTVEEVAYDSVHATGEVDPADAYTYWGFQVSTDDVHWSPFEIQGEAPENSGAQTVAATVPNLKGATKYFIRLAAVNFIDSRPNESEVFSPGPDPSFTTLPVDPPTALSAADATGVSYTTAQASGEVERPANPAAPPFDPNSAFNVHCRFEFVTQAQFEATGFAGAGRGECNQNPVEELGPKPVSAELTGLQPGTTYHLRLVAENAGGSDSVEALDTFATEPVATPSVPQIAVGAVGYNSAAVTGKVNRPAGTDPAFETYCRFEFVTDAQFASTGFEGAAEVGCEPETIINAPGPGEVHATLTGLTRATTYHVRLSASNAGGVGRADGGTFATPTAPQAQTLGAQGVGADSASLSGRINPSNGPVVYQFEWGTSAAYGNVAPPSRAALTTADEAFTVVTAPISGLGASTTYHYRLVAENTTTHEVSTGEDMSFTTPAAGTPSCPNESSRVGLGASLPDCRAYELATPGLNGTAVLAGAGGGARPDGSGVFFRTVDAAEDTKSSPTAFNIATALRGPNGWHVKTTAPPTPLPITNYGTIRMLGISADLEKTLVQTSEPLLGPSSPSGINVYLQEADGTVKAVTRLGVPFPEPPRTSANGGTEVTAASPDLTHIFVRSQQPQVASPYDPSTSFGNTFIWVNGELRLLGVLPGSIPADGRAILDSHGMFPISRSGSEALFQVGGPPPGVYLRFDDRETVDVAESQRTIEPSLNSSSNVCPDDTGNSLLKEGCGVGMSSDGSKALFLSRAELTNDANTGSLNNPGNPIPGQGDLYSYDVESGKLTDLTVDDNPADAATGANVISVVGADPNASYVYFIATGSLAPGAVSGEPNLYVEHDGQFSLIASGPAVVGGAYVTPDGRHAAFLSTEKLTGYDNVNPNTGSAEPEVYVYGYKEGLVCASCRPDGTPPMGAASFARPFAGASDSRAPRTLSDDGSRVFFQTSDKLVPADVNGDQGCKRTGGGVTTCEDVYEYVNGAPHLLSPGRETLSYMVDASASGNDVFIATSYPLTADAEGDSAAVYDARVDADTFRPASPSCQGEGCRGAGTSPGGAATAGTAGFKAAGRLGAQKSKTARAKQVSLRVSVPGAGLLKLSGKGLKAVKKKAVKGGVLTLKATLSASADKTRLKKGAFRTKARITFTPNAGTAFPGSPSKAVVALRFEAPIKKGGH